MSLAAVRTQRLALRPLVAADLDEYVARVAPGKGASVGVAEELGMTHEREVPFHDRPAMLSTSEV